jgi:hypothetical protein
VSRWLGVALLATMPVHVALRPEHGWLLLSACDVVAVAAAIGAILAWPRVVASAGLFAIVVGVPVFAVALATVYPVNPTGLIVHLLPPLLGGIAIARDGLPPRAALFAWCGFVAALGAGYALAPPELNINMATKPWPPVARVFAIPGTFQLAMIVTIAAVLWTGEAIIRAVLRGRAARRAAP